MRRKKKKIFRKSIINLTNVFMILCSIFASYFAVFLSNSFSDISFKKANDDNIEYSTYRIAQAFEEYNQKRFTP